MEQYPDEEAKDKPLDVSDSVPGALARLHNAHHERHAHHGDPEFIGHIQEELTQVGIERASVNTILPTNLADSIERIVGALTEEAAQDPALEPLLKRLRGRDRIIQGAIGNYVSTLIQFYNITRTNAWRDSEEIRDKLVIVDERRRRCHNSLIEAMTVYTKTIKELEQEGYLDNFSLAAWEPGEPLPEPTANTVVVFSGRFLQNRDRIKDWAIDVDVAVTLADIQSAIDTPNDEGHRQ